MLLNIDPHHEIVHKGEIGVCIEPNAMDSLGATISIIIEIDYQTLSNNCRRGAFSSFNKYELAQENSESYKSLL